MPPTRFFSTLPNENTSLPVGLSATLKPSSACRPLQLKRKLVIASSLRKQAEVLSPTRQGRLLLLAKPAA